MPLPICFPFVTKLYSTPDSSASQLPHLTGTRGLLTASFLLWLFFSTFFPAAVYHADPSVHFPPTKYASVIRKTLSPLFWNESLIYNFMIFLSARSICVPFLGDPNRTTASSAIFRRAVRLVLPTAIALALSVLIMQQTSTYRRVSVLQVSLSHPALRAPIPVPSALVFLNALFNLFWTTRDVAAQAANAIFPANALWVVTTLFMQSHTVYMTMLIIPHTRPSWRTGALAAFATAAWWVQSWAWYSISALLLADAVANMDFATHTRCGVALPFSLPRLGKKESAVEKKDEGHRIGVPAWLVYGGLIAAGLAMKYAWSGWQPQLGNAELRAHSGQYEDGALNEEPELGEPQARVDDFLVISGLLLTLETYGWARWCVGNRVLVFLGKRSFAYFLVAPTIVYAFGAWLFLELREGKDWRQESAVALVGGACLPVVMLGAEVFYWLVDVPSVKFARWLWRWMTK